MSHNGFADMTPPSSGKEPRGERSISKMFIDILVMLTPRGGSN